MLFPNIFAFQKSGQVDPTLADVPKATSRVQRGVELVDVPDDKAFGERLQQLRKKRGLSQVELASKLGIHQSLISQYERGYLRLHGALLVRLAQALGTTPDAILGTGPQKEEPSLDRRFVRRLQKIERLSAHQKKILLGTIDAFLSKAP
jgi:transcriptional regulator with XRE-family HTH domain